MPRRESLRQRKIAADPLLASGVDSESSKGGIVLAANAGVKPCCFLSVFSATCLLDPFERSSRLSVSSAYQLHVSCWEALCLSQ